MNPLPVAGAGGELIDFRLIDRDQLGGAKILTDMTLNICQGHFCPRYPVPDAIALSFEGRQTTFGALDLASNQVANGLIAAGIKAQRRVAILDKNSDIFFEVLLGAAKTNAVLVPINSRLAAPEIAFILNDAEAEVLFVGESFAVTLTALRDQLTTVKLVVVLDAAYIESPAPQSDVDPN